MAIERMVCEEDPRVQECFADERCSRGDLVWGLWQAQAWLDLSERYSRAMYLVTNEEGHIAAAKTERERDFLKFEVGLARQNLVVHGLQDILAHAENTLRAIITDFLLKARLLLLRVEDVDQSQIVQQLRRMFAAPEFLQILAELNVTLDDLTPRSLHGLFEEGRISIEVWARAIVGREQHLKEDCEKFAEVFDEVKQGFVAEIRARVAEGTLPEGFLCNLHRLNNLKLRVIDSFLNGDVVIAGNASCSGVISLNTALFERPPELLREVICHELLHVISGLSLSLETTDELDVELIHRKIGLVLSGYGRFPVGRWFNEAVTEWLALDLAGGGTSDDYADELNELGRLFELGLSRECVLEAYCENFRSDTSGVKQRLAYAKLMQDIRDKVGAVEFARLNNVFAMKSLACELNRMGLFPIPDQVIGVPDDVAIFGLSIDVKVVIGNTAKTQVEKHFRFWLDPAPDGKGSGKSVEERMSEMEQRLAEWMKYYGRHAHFKMERLG